MIIAKPSTNSMSINSGTVGAEPNFTGTYAQYESGTTVFYKYYNFAGASRPGDWNATTGTMTYNNGVTGAPTTRIETSAKYDYTAYVQDAFGYMSAYTNTGDIGWSDNTTGTGGVVMNAVSSKYAVVLNSATNTVIVAGSLVASQVFSIWGYSTTLMYAMINYANQTSDNHGSLNNPMPMDIFAGGVGNTFVQWNRLRVRPPLNGSNVPVMPSTSIGVTQVLPWIKAA